MSIADDKVKCPKCGKLTYHTVRDKNTKIIGCIECSPEKYRQFISGGRKSGCFSLIIVLIISTIFYLV